MIERIYSRECAYASDDYYGGKLESYLNAYGTGYDFCRIYSFSPKGSLLLYNANAVISGSAENFSELSAFLLMNRPDAIECDKEVSDRLTPDGYDKVKRTLFRIRSAPTNEHADELSLRTMYDILSTSFDGIFFDLWYTDLSHRIRHNISMAVTYKSAACASVDFIHNGRAYISSLAVKPEHRRKGYARTVLDIICGSINAEGYLWATEESAEYYYKSGFEAVKEDIMFYRAE